MYTKILFLFVVLCFASPQTFAHSVNYTITKSESITLKAGFGSDDPMSYASVKIYSPDNSEIEFQNGRTDRNGCFSFIPDKPGKWTITVIDSTGHGLKDTVSVNELMKLTETKSHGLTFIQKLFIALCIIWGALGTYLYVKNEKRRA